MSKKKEKGNKVRKALSVANIIIGIILFLIGVALLAFFGWLGVRIWEYFGL